LRTSAGRARAFLPTFAAASLAGGCATILQGTHESLDVDSTPTGAKVRVEPVGVELVTPGCVVVPRDQKIQLRFELLDHASREETVHPQTGGATFLNFLVGGFPGVQMFPNPIHAQLEPARPPAGPGERTPEPARVLFLNTTSAAIHGEKSVIAIHVDDRLVGTLEVGEYLPVDLEPGGHRLHLQHRDMWLFDDEYDFEVEAGRSMFEVYSRPISTKSKRLEAVPPDFGAAVEQ